MFIVSTAPAQVDTLLKPKAVTVATAALEELAGGCFCIQNLYQRIRDSAIISRRGERGAKCKIISQEGGVGGNM